MKAGFWGYLRAAFNARPIGMIIPPNWVGIGVFALLGLLNPGFWAIGAGLELAYLFTLSSSRRFQNYVDATQTQATQEGSAAKVRQLLAQLVPPSRQRYDALERRCRAILEQQRIGPGAASDLQLQGEGLGRLMWIYLRLLVSRQAIDGLLRDSLRDEVGGAGAAGESLERRIQRLRRQLEDPPPEPDDLRRSLTSQLEILQQRLDAQREAREKLAFLDAELTRIEEQVELIREQAVVSTDPAALSQRIDQIAAGLSGTNQWIRDQQQLYGQVEDVLEEPPPVIVPQVRA
jgi:hypothetical protein